MDVHYKRDRKLLWLTMLKSQPSHPKKEKRLKGERLEARLTVEQKELLQHAASLEGTTLTDFVVRTAQEQARRIISEQTQIQLSLEDSQAFVDSLLNPPEPNVKMITNAQEYQRSVG